MNREYFLFEYFVDISYCCRGEKKIVFSRIHEKLNIYLFVCLFIYLFIFQLCMFFVKTSHSKLK